MTSGPTATGVEVVFDACAELGEGPVWDAAASCLRWVDITAGAVHRWDPATREDRAVRLGQDVGAVAIRRSGGLIAAVRDGVVALAADGTVERLVDIEANRPGNRCNDGKCDSAGRFWVGTMASDDSGSHGALYRVDGGSVTAMVTDLGLSNGLGWSPDDRTMYLIDTDAQAVDAFDFDASSGEISARRRLIVVDEADGSPDGMTVDADGRLWVALYGGGALRCYAPTGELEEVIDLPVRQPTCPTFGGPGLADLYITSARQGLSPDELAAEPSNGALLRCRPRAVGLPPNAFVG